jgi:RNA polymerase sigma-70 factor (ECF subfamily)
MTIPDNDNELIDAALEEQEGSFDRLIEKYKDYAFNLAMMVLGDRQLAEEVVQDSFVKAFKSLSGFRRTARFSTWLYRIVYTTSLDAVKNERKRIRFSGLDEVKSAGHFWSDSSIDADYIRAELSIAIKALPRESAMIITLFYLNEQSIDEISKVLKMNTNRVKVKLYRARKKLQESLQHIEDLYRD